MANQPNVVIFLTDQQRWDSSSLHGNPLELMPNFDRLAARGTHIAHSFTCQPVCGPARACLQTGQYATTTGSWSNGTAHLPDDAPKIAELFNDAGYATGYVGKWHLAGEHSNRGPNDGGAVFEPGRGGWRHWLGVQALEFSVHEYRTILYDNDNQPVELPGYRSDAVADAGIRFIHEHQDQPFVLMMSFIEPHHQNDKDDYPPPDGYRERYAGRWTPPDLAALPSHNQTDPPAGGTTQQHLGGYWGMIKRLDEGLGRVTDALKSLDLEDNTIVLFTSDHGCHFKTRNSEYKRSCHESSIRVPTALWGGPFEAGGQVGELVSLVDLPPTLLDACGIDVPDAMQGRSILPLLRGGREDWPEQVFVQISEAETGRAVRTHRWKYAVTAPQQPGRAAADEYTEAYLYDLHHDPYELCNLIDRQSHDEVRKVMRDRLLRHIEQIEGATPKIIEVESKPSGQRIVREEEVRQ